MSWLCDSTELVSGGWLTSRYAGHGVLGAVAPAAGEHGPGFFAGISHPAEDASEFRLLVLSRPASLPGLLIAEDGTVEVPEDSPAGTHEGTWRLYKDGAAQLPDPSTYTIVIGTGLTGTVTLDGPGVTGGMSVAGPSVLGGSVSLDGPQVGGNVNGNGPSRPPQSVGFFIVKRRTVRLAAVDPQEVPDLSPMAAGDTETFEFDMGPNTNVTAPLVTVARVGGDDGLPGITKVGDAVVVQGSYVLQRLAADLTALGSAYQISATVTTETGDRITATGRVPVRIC